jgi:hypothetical protein
MTFWESSPKFIVLHCSMVMYKVRVSILRRQTDETPPVFLRHSCFYICPCLEMTLDIYFVSASNDRRTNKLQFSRRGEAKRCECSFVTMVQLGNNGQWTAA